METKETLTQRAKKLLFANSEAGEFYELKLRFESDGLSDYDKKELEKKNAYYYAKCHAYMELLGRRVAEPVYFEGLWSARKRWAEERNITDPYAFDW